jgi:hypothetical protein
MLVPSSNAAYDVAANSRIRRVASRSTVTRQPRNKSDIVTREIPTNETAAAPGAPTAVGRPERPGDVAAVPG